MADDFIRLSELPEASDSQLTNDALMELSVENEETASGYETRKSPLSRLADYFLNSFTSLNLGGSQRTVKAAIDAHETSITDLSGNLSSVIRLETVQIPNVSVPANSNVTVTGIYPTIEGYSFRAILSIRFDGTGTTDAAYAGFLHSTNWWPTTSSQTANIAVRNLGSNASKATVNALCLYTRT